MTYLHGRVIWRVIRGGSDTFGHEGRKGGMLRICLAFDSMAAQPMYITSARKQPVLRNGTTLSQKFCLATGSMETFSFLLWVMKARPSCLESLLMGPSSKVNILTGKQLVELYIDVQYK